MQQLAEQNPATFVDRRSNDVGSHTGPERRQFADSREETTPEVRELANAVDQYKLLHRRRFITFEELHDVIVGLGYHK